MRRSHRSAHRALWPILTLAVALGLAMAMALLAVSIHAGRAAVGEIGSSDPPAMMAIGEAIDVANELRKAAVAQGVPFAISEQVYTGAGLVPNCEKKNHGAIPRPRDTHSRLSVRIGGGIGASRAHRVAFANAEISAQATGVIGRRSVGAGRARKR